MLYPQITQPFAFLSGGGVCGELIASRDWSSTSLGPIERWPISLTATIAIMLHTKQQMVLFWGPELIQFYNDSFIPSFGVGKHPAAMGQRGAECWAESWPIVGKQIEAVMSRGEPAWFENALIPSFRNGRMEEVFWTYSFSPAFDDRGLVHGTLVIATETTSGMLFARRLEALAQLAFTLASATSHDAVFTALAAVVEKWPSDLPHVSVRPSTASSSRELRDIVLDAGVVGPTWPEPVTTALTCAVGASRDLVVGISPRLPLDDAYRSFIAQIAGLVATAIGRIDEANQTLAIERQRDNLLMHAPVAAALLAGPNHVFQLANPLYCKLVGRNPVGKAYRDAFPERRESPIPAMLDRVYQTGTPLVTNEQLVSYDRKGNGVFEDRYLNFSLEPMRDDAGAVYGMMSVVLDVTDQVRARIELQKIDEERGRALVALQDANRTKDEFLAMLGHELRNPLAPIVTAIEMMNQKDGAAGPERAVIERQLRYVIRLVDDLLDISKITRGKVSLEMRPVNLRSVIDAAVESSRHLMEQRGHRLTVDSEGNIFVMGDEGRLVQIVLNLMTNSARYTPNGGDIRVSLMRDGDDALLRVADNGVGMSPELLAKVFDAFVQGTRNADRAEGGLGLGLSIVKNLVSLHHGSVDVKSDGPGRGSIFTLRLHMLDPPRAATEIAAPQPAAAVVSRRILIVDDNEDAAILLAEISRSHGHTVMVKHDPTSALNVVRDFAPEIAVLDIGLPGMDGYQLAERIHAICPDCRLIALTGYGREGDRERSLRAGFSHHFVKPVRIAELLATFT